MAMYYDNRIRMIDERRSAIVTSVLRGGPPMLNLKLKVRRDHIMADALTAVRLPYSLYLLYMPHRVPVSDSYSLSVCSWR